MMLILSKLANTAGAAEDSRERSQAQRVLRSMTMGAGGRVQDRQYLKVIEQYGLRGRQ